VIIAIVCETELSGRVAVCSVQLATTETVIESRKSKWRWAPYFPKGTRGRGKRPVAQIRTLKFEGKKGFADKLNDEQRHQLGFLMPYELLPQKFEMVDLDTRLTNVRSVTFDYIALDGTVVPITWDKDTHRTSLDIDDYVEDYNLDEKDHEGIFKKLKEEFDAAREVERQKYKRESKEIKSLTKDEVDALRNIKIYKFYPTHKRIDSIPYMDLAVNRFLGNADGYYPDVPEAGSSKRVVVPPPLDLQKDDSASNNSVPAQTSTPIPIPASTPAPIGVSTFSVPTFKIPNGGFDAPVVPTPTSFIFGDFTVVAPSVSVGTSSGWKCACCESMNADAAMSCSTCLVSRPKK